MGQLYNTRFPLPNDHFSTALQDNTEELLELVCCQSTGTQLEPSKTVPSNLGKQSGAGGSRGNVGPNYVHGDLAYKANVNFTPAPQSLTTCGSRSSETQEPEHFPSSFDTVMVKLVSLLQQ